MNQTITKPTLLLDEKKCRRNIEKMAQKIRSAGIRFRPHFKTHQSKMIGRWFKAEGVKQITVSSLEMAEYFISDEWNDITLAVPFNPSDYKHINSIAERISLGLITASAQAVQLLGVHLKFPISIWIKFNAGNNRSGLDPNDGVTILKLIETIQKFPLMKLKGFLGHAGQSYQSRNIEEIMEVHRKSLEVVADLRIKYSKWIPGIEISLGDTPTCSIANEWPGVNELRPGNFVFYDLMQVQIGACKLEDIALAMACPIIDIRPERHEVIIHGGGIHFSKDAMKDDHGNVIYGKVVAESDEGWGAIQEGMMLKSISQEHGTLAVLPNQIENFLPGQNVIILPVHSCMTADCMGGYSGTTGNRYDHFSASAKMIPA